MAVESVEFHSIDIVPTTDATNTNTVGGPALIQSVIFPTHYLDAAAQVEQGAYTPDVRFQLRTSPDRIWSSRTWTDGLHRIGASLVEFAPGISIQSGTFVMDPGELVATQAITAVASLSQAFVIRSTRTENFNDDAGQVRSDFSADDELIFRRTAADWFLRIEWFVIEDNGIGAILSVTPFTIVLDGVLSNTATIPAVDLGKSFIACAQMTTGGFVDNSEFGTNVRLTDGTTVTADRVATGAVVTVSGFVVELVEAAASVQSGAHSFAGALLSTDTAVVTAVDDGVPWHANQEYAQASPGGGSGAGKTRVTYPTSTTVLGEYYDAFGTAAVDNYWALIEFGPAGGPPAPSNSLYVAMIGLP